MNLPGFNNALANGPLNDLPEINHSSKKWLNLTYPPLKSKGSPYNLKEEISAGSEVGATLFIIDNNKEIKYVTNRFILMGLNIALKERVQLLESFESANISFFGESARVYNFSGSAIDYASQDKQSWKTFHQSSIIKMYNEHLRGTQLIKNGALAVLKCMNHLIYGYPLNLNVSYNSNADKFSQFSMSMVVVDHRLNWVNIVDEKQLTDLYSADYNIENSSLINNINEYLTLMTKSINLNPEDVENLSLTSDISLNNFKFNLLLSESEKIEVSQIFIDNIKSFQQRINTDESEFSNSIKTLFPDNNYLNRLYIEIGEIIPYNDSLIGGYIQTINTLQNTLTSFKTRIING